MLPVGNDDHRRFYKDQEWIWTAPNEPKPSAEVGVDRPSAATKPAQPAQGRLGIHDADAPATGELGVYNAHAPTTG